MVTICLPPTCLQWTLTQVENIFMRVFMWIDTTPKINATLPHLALPSKITPPLNSSCLSKVLHEVFGCSLCQLSLGKIGINLVHVQLEAEKKLCSNVSTSVICEQANSKFRKYHVGVVSKKYQACRWTLFTSVLVLTQTAPKPFQQPRIRTLFILFGA